MRLLSKKYIKEVWGVFSSTAFCTYNWSIIIFFWDIPSFLLRYNTIDILGYAAYQFIFSLFESILVTLFVVLLALILPAKLIRNSIQVSGPALVFAFAINAIFFKNIFNVIHWSILGFHLSTRVATQVITGIWALSLIALPVGFVITSKKEKAKRGINKFVENLSVLVSLYVFLTVIGTFIVIVRNVF